MTDDLTHETDTRDTPHAPPLTEEEHTQGIVLYQFLLPRLGVGGEITIRSGHDMGCLVRALRSPEGARLFNRRFLGEVRARGDRSAPRRVPVGEPGAEADALALGRLLLRWSREVLAARSGVAVLTILNIEKGRSGGRPETRAALRGAMEAAGVVFGDEVVSLERPGHGEWTAPVPD